MSLRCAGGSVTAALLGGNVRPAACATPSRWARAAGALAALRRLARGQRVHRLGGEALAADGPVAALDLVDHAPRDAAHVLAFDADHRVGEALGDLSLLLGREDALDEPDVDEGHVPLLRFVDGAASPS